jgi:hypothetical protein
MTGTGGRAQRRGMRAIAAAGMTLFAFAALAIFGGLGGVRGPISASAHEYQYGTEPVTARVTTIQATCREFQADEAPHLAKVRYIVRSDGKIGGLNPSAIRYWTQVHAPASSFTVEVAQTETHPTFSTLFDLSSADNIRLHGSGCLDSTLPQTKSIAGDQASVSVTGATPGETYVLSVRYQTQPFLGKHAPNPPVVHYDFQTKLNGALVDGDQNGLDLVRN